MQMFWLRVVLLVAFVFVYFKKHFPVELESGISLDSYGYIEQSWEKWVAEDDGSEQP